MECKIFEDKNRDEEVLIFVHEINNTAREIKDFVLSRSNFELLGYLENEIKKIELSSVNCFTLEDGRLFALCDSKKYQIKSRLYHIEEHLPGSFVKINQSSIANIDKIEKFEASFGGALMVKFKNGYKDYVSRRQLKLVKERLGIIR